MRFRQAVTIRYRSPAGVQPGQSGQFPVGNDWLARGRPARADYQSPFGVTASHTGLSASLFDVAQLPTTRPDAFNSSAVADLPRSVAQSFADRPSGPT